MVVGTSVCPFEKLFLARLPQLTPHQQLPRCPRWLCGAVLLASACHCVRPSYAVGASVGRACLHRTLSAATARAVVAGVRACCSIAFAAAANPASFSFCNRNRGASEAASAASAFSATRLPCLSASAMLGVCAAHKVAPRPASAAAPVLLAPAPLGRAAVASTGELRCLAAAAGLTPVAGDAVADPESR
jgi:hypothetical protein